jgi:4-amino-4-deoxy-L-arabinose transferase-like glycosyltransferase
MTLQDRNLAAPFAASLSVKEEDAEHPGGREILECAAVGLLALAVFFFHSWSYALWEPDEARYAEVPREMLATGNFIIPHLNYVPYIEKPPLLYWLTSLAFHFLGTNEFAARMVPALSALATVAVVYWFGRRVFDHRCGILASAILITSPMYAAMAQVLTTDMLLTALLTVAFFTLFLQWCEGGRWWVVSYLAIALAILTKGPIGIVLPALTLMLFLWRQGGLRNRLTRLHPVPGFLLVLVVALPWFLIMAAKLPGYLEFYVAGEHIRRVFVSGYSHNQPFYFYLPVILAGTLPWSICSPLLLTDGTRGPARSFCAIAVGLVLVIFSLARAKLIPYILPAVPLLALLLANSILGSIKGRRTRWFGWRIKGGPLIAAVGPVLCVGGIAGIILRANASHFPAQHLVMLSQVILASSIILLVGGVAMSAAVIRGRSELGLTIAIVAVATAILAGTYGRLDLESSHSSAAISRDLAIRAPTATLIDYGHYHQAIPFYTHRRVILAAPLYGELSFGAEHISDSAQYFLDTDAELLNLWAKERSAVLIIDVDDFQRLAPRLGPTRIIARQGRKLAVAKDAG